MIGVNLIPSGVLRTRQRSSRIRRWAVAAAIAAALGAVPVLVEVRQHARLAKLAERKEAATAELAEVRAKLQTVSASRRQLHDGIERANTLRTRRPWAGLLIRMVECLPDEVWLTSLATETPQDLGSSSPRKSRRQKAAPRPAARDADSPAVVTLAGARRLNLHGFAVDHEQLYEFMARLKGSETFGGVELVKAGKEPVLRSQGVCFELTCTW